MKKIIFYSVTTILIGCASDSEKNKQLKINLDTLPNIANISFERKEPSNLSAVFADSANKFEPDESIPTFFYNYKLDYENPWLTDHRTLSVRKSIFDSTKNVFLLNELLKSDDYRLQKIIDSSEVSDKLLLESIPFKNLSNYEMAQIRLEEIKKLKK